MKPDDFENELARLEPRPIPTSWRAEILEAANAAARQDDVRAEGRAKAVAPPWWRQLLWPCPQAWAGLAAVWIIIVALHVTPSPESRSIAQANPGESTERTTALSAQRRELVHLLENPSESRPAPKPGVISPRTQRWLGQDVPKQG